MQLIVFSGLPGTGKSTIAEAVGRKLQIPVFAKDWLEATLRRSELQASDESKSLGYAGYELLTTLTERQLMLEQSVILDSVASIESIRTQWRALAAQYGASWRVVECVWSNESAHRAELARRERYIPGWHELEWSEVERVRAYHIPWNEARLILDAANSLDSNIARAVEYLNQSDGNVSH